MGKFTKKAIQGWGVIIFVFFGLLVSQESEKNKIEQFLEDIKNILRRIYELKANQSKKKDKSKKQLHRKKIISKLANPFRRTFSSHIINTDKLSPSSPTKQESDSLNFSEERQMIQGIKTYFKTNPAANPFKEPSLTSILKKLEEATKNTSFQNPPSLKDSDENQKMWYEYLLYMDTLKEWYYQLLEKSVSLWYIIESKVVKNKNFSTKICPGANAEDVFKGIAKDFTPSKVIQEQTYLNLRESPSTFGPLGTNFHQTQERKLGLKYATAVNTSSNPNNTKITRLSIDRADLEQVTKDSPLCKDILILNHIGYIIQRYPVEQLRKCLEDFYIFKNASSENCDFKRGYLKLLIKIIYENSRKWFKLFKYIIEKKLPQIEEEKQAPKSPQTSLTIEDTIYLLLFQNVVLKDIDTIEILYDIKTDNYELLKNNKCSLEEFTKNREAFVRVLKKLQLTQGDSSALEQVIKNLENGEIVEAFTSMLKVSPVVLVSILKSSEFLDFIMQVKKLKEKLLTNRNDVCTLLILSVVATKSKEIAWFLTYNNLDGAIWKVNEISFMMPLNEYDSNPENILRTIEKLSFLSYYIYRNIVLYKLEKCQGVVEDKKAALEQTIKCVEAANDLAGNEAAFLDKIKMCGYVVNINNPVVFMEKLKGCGYKKGITRKEDLPSILERCGFKVDTAEPKSVLERYACIFEKNLNVKCFFDENANKAMIELIDKLGGITLIDAYQKLSTLKGKRLVDILDSIKQMCDSELQQCLSYAEFVDVSLYKYFCGPSNWLGLLNLFCPDDFRECKVVENDTTKQYCYKANSSPSGTSYIIDANKACREDDECNSFLPTLTESETGIAYMGYRLNTPSPKVAVGNFCKHLKTNVNKCCIAVQNITGENIQEKVDNLTKLSSFSCQALNLTTPISESTMLDKNRLKFLLGEYFDILEERIKNLKELYSRKEECY